MSDARIDDEMVEDLMNLMGLGLGVVVAFGISNLMIASANAQADRFAASVEHSNHQATLDLATTAECVAKILGTRKTSANALEKIDTQAVQDLFKSGMSRLAVT